MEVLNGKIELEDQAIAPGTHFTLTPVNASADGVSLDLKHPVPVKVELSINDGADIRLTGTLVPKPFSAKLDLAVEEAELSLAQPYVSQQAALTIRDGSLDAKGKLLLNQGSATQPKLAFQGDVQFQDFKSVDNTLHEDFVNFKGLELEKVKFTHAPDALEIERIVARQPYARMVLSDKQVLNISEVLSPEDKVSAEAPKPQAEPAPELQATREKMPVKIGTVFVSDMRLNFSDYSVQPNFSAEIQALKGTLKGLSSEPKSRADVQLEGNMGENSPVVISGKTQVFDYDKFTDLSVKCENIPLPVFNPYAGRFAGYAIERGELTTDIHYLLHKRKFKAEHHLRINQLVWGEKTETKEKAPVPVRLATALLRDREGVINLDVPVDGTLDDPKFKVWPVVWQVFKNIIVKAATAPFDLLGSLFKGAEKARYVEFAPGKAELNQNAKTGLASLNKALMERPKLTLDVPIGTVNDLDRKALADQKFQEGLKRSATATLSRRAKRSGVPPYEELDEDQKIDALEKLYEDLTGDEPEVKDAPKRSKDASRKAAKESETQFKLDELTTMTRKRVTVEQSELDALGRKRGEAIEAELLKAGKLESNRVLLSKKGKVSGEKNKVRYEMGLQ